MPKAKSATNFSADQRFSSEKLYVREGLRKETILNAVDDSLRRLNTDYLDLCYVHSDLKEFLLYERLEALMILEKQGKIRTKGCCNITNERYLESESINEKEELSSFQAIQQKFSYLLPHQIDDQASLKFLDTEMTASAELTCSSISC